ncbi:MAG: tetratricopeptide repeat protein [Nitrospirota bacterium]
MSLINEALKKAARETGPDEDALQHAYPQKIFFIAGRPPGRRPLTMVLGGVAVLAGLAALAWQAEPVRHWLLGITGERPASRSVATAPPVPESVEPKPPADVVQPPPPDRAEIERRLQAAVAAFRKGDWEPARAAFAAALELDPSLAAAHNGLGLIEKARGNSEQAESHYLEAIRLDSRYAEAHNNLALLYDQRGETDRAIAEYSTALSLRPEYPEARLNYAIALERSGRRAEAKREYQKFLAANPPELADVAGKVKAHVAQFP